MKPYVECYCDTDLVHAAYAVTGLIELADQGEIELRFRISDSRLRRPNGTWVLWLHVRLDKDEWRVGIDCHDCADYLCPDTLAACTHYFKSNLNTKSFEVATPEHRTKLHPLGPYLPCRPLRDRALLRRWLGSCHTKIRQRLFISPKRMSLVNNLREINQDLHRLRRYRSRKTWSDYEVPPQPSAVEPNVILFNPSCWDESEGDEIRRMNVFRARLIVALREAFGPRFIGGFRRLGTAYHRYPEAVETSLLSHEEYVASLTRSKLAAYTNGKWGCFSWRFAETLAASKCIVSETIPNDAGVQLDENVGIVQCQTVEQITETLLQLDADPERTAEYARRAQLYYLNHVRPQVCMRRLLDEVLQESPTASTSVAVS